MVAEHPPTPERSEADEFFVVLDEIVAEWGKYHDDDGITRIPTDQLREQVLRLRRLSTQQRRSEDG